MPRKTRAKKSDNKENQANVDKKEIDELDVLGDIPELQAPRELMDLLDNKATTSREYQSSDDEWDEVEAEIESTADQMVVEVNIQRKKTKEEQMEEEYATQLRLAVEREKRKIIVDFHKIHFLAYMSHLRYQMLTVKKFCSNNKLSEFTPDFNLIEDELLDFRKKFKLSGQKKMPTGVSVDRLRHITENLVYENNRDLVLAFVAALLSAEFHCRICIGFTPKPDLPDDQTNMSDSEPKSKKKKLSKEAGENYWLEYFNDNNWIPVHPINDDMFSMEQVEEYKPFKYALAIDNDFNMFDITGWYQKRYLDSAFRKSRLSDTWINLFLELPVFTTVPKRRLIEKHRLTNYLRSKPFPTTIKEFKDHPLYVLERDLLKFEAIYPKDTQPLGQIRKENIYPRSTVHVLKNKLTWIKLGRSVVEEEKAYKVVKAAPKLGIPADERVPMFMDVFGYWQTVPYILPKVIDGKIERNDFGNIYMFLPSMLPLNCVHLHLTGVHQVARTLGLEAVPAVVGWDFKKGRNYPVIDGCVVLEKDAEILKEAWKEWDQEKGKPKENKGKVKGKKRSSD